MADRENMIVQRPRRLRTCEGLRRMVQETRLNQDALVYPVFVREGSNIKEEIASMPGQYRYSADRLHEGLEEALEAGVSRIMLFGIPGHKDELGSGAYAEDGVVQQGLRRAREQFPEIYLVGDVCMCEYTSHGHCGILEPRKSDGRIDVDNDRTLEYLAKIAVSQARAGACMIAPSDMMDGRIGRIRRALDEEGFGEVPIMAYSAKYASSFYGPFRDAAGSAPAFGDRSTYQMDIHNSREAVKEVLLDVEEGADIVMVKPAMAYGDIIRQVRDRVQIPVAAYSVSGEYAMIKAAAAKGWIDEKKMMCETAVSAFRAGADIYITYYAKELAECIRQGRI